MCYPLVMKISNPVNHLFKVVAGEVLREGRAPLFHQRKKITALDELKHYEENLDTVARGFDHDLPLQVVLEKLDDSWVVHRREERNLVCQHLLELVEADGLDLVPLDDLDRVKAVRPFVPRQFDPEPAIVNESN